MALSCWRCARCRALTRTWRGHMRFAPVGGSHRPVCEDRVACRERARGPREERWLDGSDQLPARQRRRAGARRNLSEGTRRKLAERMRRINEERRRRAREA